MNIAKVLAVLLRDPITPAYGYDVMQQTGLKSGQMYPVLGRLETAGWIEGRTEAIDSAAEARPPRRYYVLTPNGTVLARQALAELQQALRVVSSDVTEGRVRLA